MGITGILRWSNPALGTPNGLDLVVQRVNEQYGQNVVRKPYQAQIRQHKPTQLIPRITQSDPIQNAIDPSRPQANATSPESLITVMYPRNPRSADTASTAFVQQIRHQKQQSSNANIESSDPTFNTVSTDVTQVEVVGRKPEEMRTMGPEELVPWLQEQGAKGNKYLVYPRAIIDPAGKNIANMTASLLAPTKKARAIDPYASTTSQINSLQPGSGSRSAPNPNPTPTLAGGTLISIDGIQLDISLGGVGMSTGVEWVVKAGWVAGMGGEGGRGLVIEAEYLPVEIMPSPPSTSEAQSPGPCLPLILQEFLLSLLPEVHPLAIPPVYNLSFVPEEDRWTLVDGAITRSQRLQGPRESRDRSSEDTTHERSSGPWAGQERLRRLSWMLVEGLKEDGVLA